MTLILHPLQNLKLEICHQMRHTSPPTTFRPQNHICESGTYVPKATVSEEDRDLDLTLDGGSSASTYTLLAMGLAAGKRPPDFPMF